MCGVRRLVASALTFSVLYAFIEYYLIRDTTFGYGPVLFSLVYPYHFVMAVVFGLTACGMLSVHVGMKGLTTSMILICALFSSMLAVEDFMWFTLRAVAPVDGDVNAGKLVMSGEWTTRFMGSFDAHFTMIPNWYFLSAGFSGAALATMRSRQRLTAVASA